MRTLLLALLLIASVGPALVYRLTRPSLDASLGARRARGLAGGIIATALVAISLIVLRLPIYNGALPLVTASAAALLAVTLAIVAWRAARPAGPRRLAVGLLGPTAACVFGIMLAAFLAVPHGWRFL